MDFNKTVAGILTAGVVFVATLIVSEGVFAPDTLKTQAYVIDTGVVQTANAEDASKPAYLAGAEFAALVDKADTVKGSTTFKKCVACHSNDNGGANKIGPNLWGVFEKKIASKKPENITISVENID